MKKLLFVLLFISAPVWAGGSSHHNDDGDVTNNTLNQTNVTVHKHNHNAGAFIAGAVFTCAVVSIWNQRPCWRDREKTVDLKPKHDDEIILKGE
jgi:hypothetical protein